MTGHGTTGHGTAEHGTAERGTAEHGTAEHAAPEHASSISVDVSEAMDLLAAGAVMIDVRAQKEWEAGHSPHAVHIPMEEIPRAIGITSRTRRIIVASRSGRRAKEAVTHLRTGGVDAVTLTGGLHAWVAAGGEFVSTSGAPPKVT